MYESDIDTFSPLLKVQISDNYVTGAARRLPFVLFYRSQVTINNSSRTYITAKSCQAIDKNFLSYQSPHRCVGTGTKNTSLYSCSLQFCRHRKRTSFCTACDSSPGCDRAYIQSSSSRYHNSCIRTVLPRSSRSHNPGQPSTRPFHFYSLPPQ